MNDETDYWVVEEKVLFGWEACWTREWVSGNGESKWVPEIFETCAQAEVELQDHLESYLAAYKAGDVESAPTRLDYRIVRRQQNEQ